MNGELFVQSVTLGLQACSNRELCDVLHALADELKVRAETDAANFVTRAFACVGENANERRGRPRVSVSPLAK